MFSGAEEWSSATVGRLKPGWEREFRRRERRWVRWAWRGCLVALAVTFGLLLFSVERFLAWDAAVTYPDPGAEVWKADHWGWYCAEYPKVCAAREKERKRRK